MKPSRPRTKLQRTGSQRARREVDRLAAEIERLREDAGLSRRAVARAAGISASTHAAIEARRASPSIEVAARIAAVLGAELAIRLHPGAGPLVRDHLQAAMLEELFRIIHPRWKRSLEVPVFRPVRGVIDAVLEDEREGVVVAAEAQSELRRLEQQVRWAELKAAALALGREDRSEASVSRLLILRSVRSTRAVAREYGELLSVAYPAPHEGVLAALTSTAPWPGPGILWCDVDTTEARFLERPPRGVGVGRRGRAVVGLSGRSDDPERIRRGSALT